MSITYGKDNKTSLQAQYDAQKIAFAPIMFQAAMSLRNLGILDLLKGSRSGLEIETVAEKLSLPVYGVKVLLEAGLSLELVTVSDDKFNITKTGWFFLRDELTKVNADFTNDVNYLGMFSLEESIKTQKPTGLKVFGDWSTVYEALSELPPKVQQSWFAFDHYYSDYAFPEILPTVFKDKPKWILDVGGNTGKFSIKCAEYDESVKVTILDLPGQLAQAEKNIAEHGFAERINGHPINLLDHSIPFPKGAEAIWMSQFLDCFSPEDISRLLQRSKEAMTAESALFIMETYWDLQRFEASTYSLHAISLYFTNIANGCSKMYHSEEMLALIKGAGLEVVERHEDVGVSHTLFKCKRKPDSKYDGTYGSEQPQE